tara:strand:- start:2 stop:349 length:348 start_codon:yes stop_codon:yes gene_type:complete
MVNKHLNWQKSLIEIKFAFAGSASKGLNLFEALVLRETEPKYINDMIKQISVLSSKEDGNEWQKLQKNIRNLLLSADQNKEIYESIKDVRDDIAQDLAIGIHQVKKIGKQATKNF